MNSYRIYSLIPGFSFYLWDSPVLLYVVKQFDLVCLFSFIPLCQYVIICASILLLMNTFSKFDYFKLCFSDTFSCFLIDIFHQHCMHFSPIYAKSKAGELQFICIFSFSKHQKTFSKMIAINYTTTSIQNSHIFTRTIYFTHQDLILSVFLILAILLAV